MMKPWLPRQVATRPFTAEDGWRFQRAQIATVSPFGLFICIIDEYNYLNRLHKARVIIS